MSNNYVQVPPNSSGVKLQTFENTIGLNVVDAEAVALVDTTGVSILGTAGSPNTDVLTIQGISGGTAVSISGTVNQGSAGASPWPFNLTQFGSSAVVTGTGASGAGIPRVTVSNDSAVVQGTAAASTAGWPTISGNVAETTAAWTSATTINTALAQTVTGYGSVVVTLNQGSTITGGVVTFEVSDTTAGTNWYAINGQPINFASTNNFPPVFTYSLVASTNQAFQFNVAGFVQFRVRLSTVINGTATVNVGIQSSAGAASPATLGVIGQVSIKSINGQVALADNQADVSIFANLTGTTVPLAVGDAIYGGAFSGTNNAALSGWSKMRAPTVFKTIAAVSVTAGTPATVWTPGSGNKFRFMGYAVSLSVAGSVIFKDSGTEIVRTPLMGAGIGQPCPPMGNFGYLSSAANNVLQVDVSATGTVSGFVFGTEE